MKLYMVPLAPNPTKIMLYLKERELAGHALPVEQIVVNTVKGRHKEPEHLARNPFGTVPALELDDGTFLKESLTILEYFEDAYPEGNFQAATAEARDLATVLRQLLHDLPPSQRETIDLWCEGFSYAEIAEITDRSPGNVRVLAHRGLAALRSHPLVRSLLPAAPLPTAPGT